MTDIDEFETTNATDETFFEATNATDETFFEGTSPARSAVGVAELRGGVDIEVEAIATTA